MNRRSVAPLIRARQEIWKRVDRFAPIPRWRGVADTMSMLDARSISQAAGGHDDAWLHAIAQTVRGRAPTRFPVAHLAHRDQQALGNAPIIIAEAERILRGDWDVLGTAVHVDVDAIDWLAHPVSAVRVPLRHFSQVSYAADTLGGDVKFLWEINRHAELVRLAQAYWLTRRPEFARAAVRLLESWIQQNPPGTGINWLSVVDVAFRMIAWCWVWSLTSDSDAWTDATIARMIWMVGHAGRFIARYDSVHHSPNTHLTGEALGLIYIATVFPELTQASTWKQLGISILKEEVPYQFLDDGMHYERCTGYHRYHLEFYLHSLAIARSSGERWADAFRTPVSRAAESSIALMRPDGTWPVFGDEDAGACVRLGTREITDQRELLVVAAGLLDRTDLRAGLGSDMHDVAWWLVDDTAWRHVSNEKSTAPALVASASLPHAGYYVARDGWDGSGWYCAVDAGPHGGERTGHAHTDVGHVELARGDELIVVDPGCSVYTSSPELRNWFRSQHAHASLTVDGVELAIPSSAFGWRSVAPTPVVDAADHGAFWYCRLSYMYSTPGGPVTHERHVVLIRHRGVVVCDVVIGTGLRSLAISWPLGVRHGDVQLEAADSALIGDATRMHWVTAHPAGLVAFAESTRVSPKFGVEVDASLLRVAATDVALPCIVATAFEARSAPSIGVEIAHDRALVTATDANGQPIALSIRSGASPEIDRGGAAPNDRRSTARSASHEAHGVNG